MRKGGGKAKGAQFEREVCVALSKWVSSGESEDLFWRSAMSGGRATVGMKKGKALRRQAGDVSAVSAEGCALTDEFYIECRFYASLDLDSFLVFHRGRLAKFWQEVVSKSQHHKKKPMLIAKQNRCPTIVLVGKSVLGCPHLAYFERKRCTMVLFSDMLKGPLP